VLHEFIIVYMHETDNAQIILGRPILATAGCHIDVRKGHITFKVEGRYAVFCHIKEKVVSPNSSLFGEFPPSPEIDMEDVLNYGDPHDFDLISYEGADQRYVNVKFAAPTPPNMPMVEADVSDESSMSNNCRFAQAILFLPPYGRIGCKI